MACRWRRCAAALLISRQGDPRATCSVYLDLEAGEERSVELASYLRPGRGVDLGAAPHQGLGLLVEVIGLVVRVLGFGEFAVELKRLPGNSIWGGWRPRLDEQGVPADMQPPRPPTLFRRPPSISDPVCS